MDSQVESRQSTTQYNPESQIVKDSKRHLVDPEYIKLLKVATAIAIIRCKPPGLTGSQYAQQVCNAFQLSQIDWKTHSQQLEMELLKIKQKTLISQVHAEGAQGMEQETEEMNPNSDTQDSVLLFPTPSSSLEEQNNECQSYVRDCLQQSTQFLRAVLSLRMLSSADNITAGFHNQLELEETTKHTITSAIQCIEDGICCSRPLNVSDKVLQSAVTAVIDLAESEMMYIFTDEILQQIAQFLQKLIALIVDQTGLNMHRQQEKLCQILLIFGRCSRLYGGVVKLLSQTVSQYGVHLREVTIGQDTLRPHQYENIYHIFCCLRELLEINAMVAGSPAALPPEVVASSAAELETATLHISERFPLFAHSVWEVAALIDCAGQSDDS